MCEEYPRITMESRGLLSIGDLDDGAFDEMIPMIEKRWSVNVANGKEGDKMRIVSGISCTDRHEIIAEADVEGYMVMWKVETELPSGNVCYGYANGEDMLWVLYEEYTVDSMFVSDVITTGNKNLLYVNKPKEYRLEGSYMDRVEEMFFVSVIIRLWFE